LKKPVLPQAFSYLTFTLRAIDMQFGLILGNLSNISRLMISYLSGYSQDVIIFHFQIHR